MLDARVRGGHLPAEEGAGVASVVRVTLLAGQWFLGGGSAAGGRDVDVALAETLAGAQAAAGLATCGGLILGVGVAGREPPLATRTRRLTPAGVGIRTEGVLLRIYSG